MKKVLGLLMNRKITEDRHGCVLVLAFVGILLFSLLSPVCTHLASAWSNGGKSTDPNNPKYGTHDWIAERALEWLPEKERALILTYRNVYLYGTELPDVGGGGLVKDSPRHHVYFFENRKLQDGAAAKRAEEMGKKASAALAENDYASAAKWTGAMAHYIADLAVFGHVMGSRTDWGAAEKITVGNYEADVQELTDSPSKAVVSLVFDGTLDAISPYDAAYNLAHDTTFDDSGAIHTAIWMYQVCGCGQRSGLHCNWSDKVFTSRVYQSINLAVNYVAEAVHTTWSAKGQRHITTTTTSNLPTMLLSASTTAAAIIVGNQKRSRKQHRRKLVRKRRMGPA